MNRLSSAASAPVVAFGPEMPGWGSWEWIGADLMSALGTVLRTCSFGGQEVPVCDVAVVVKHGTALESAISSAPRRKVIYCPVDWYGSAAEIDADAPLLRRCSRIVVHCDGLRKYFEPYAPVEYLDHHVKFAAPLRKRYVARGFLLWVGVRTNLPALVGWVNLHGLPGELRLLTNLENPESVPHPCDLGFRHGQSIVIQNWASETQRNWTSEAQAAIDIKGTDFRSRYKPPAKAIDFIASGLPLAMNADSSPVEHLARLGFEVASPDEPRKWLSRAYGEDTRRFGAALRECLSLERVAFRFRRIIERVLAGS